MRKLMLIIIFLLLCIIFSYRYLIKISTERKAFSFVSHAKPFLLQKKEIVINNEEEFVFEEFFIVFSFNDLEYRFKAKDNFMDIVVNEQHYQYPYKMKEKENETVETVIYKEIYIEKPIPMNNAPVEYTENNTDNQEETESEYFKLMNDEMTFPLETDISEIIRVCRRQIQTNMQVTIDYSQLNPNHIGQYLIFFYTDIEEYRMIINIV